MTVDVEALEVRIAEVCTLMGAHAGAIELVDVSPRGVVEVRFTGMCTGCTYRPLTMYGTIAPALKEVPGVSEVRAAGARISDEAAERMIGFLGGSTLPVAAC